jgi:non-canonical poly(A) RNA polymerase PAPD5/7
MDKSFSNFSESTNEGNSTTKEDSIVNSLFNCVDANDLTKFKSILESSSQILSSKYLEFLFLTCLSSYQVGKFYLLRYISILSYNVNPNINIFNNSNFPGEYGAIKTPLMLSCELSDFKLMKIILNSNCDVNALDHYNRNALFYLNGGSNDNDLISALVEKGINVNQQDKIEGNTPLHYLILNDKEKTAISLIDNGNANFMIKNKNDKSALELMIEKWVDNRNNRSNDVKKIINLINNKLSLENSENENKKSAENNNNNNESKIKDYNLDEKKLIKLPLKNPKNQSNIIKNTYIKLKPSPVLILDTSSNIQNLHGVDLTQKIENIKELNNNKRFFYELIQHYKNKLIDSNQNSMKKLEEIKYEIENKKNILEKFNNLYYNKNPGIIKLLKSKYNEIQSKITLIKEKISPHQNSFDTIIPNGNMLKKFSENNEDEISFSREYITKQLQIDLIDFRDYVHSSVDQSQPILEKLTSLINKYVTESLGSDYNIKVYGSRATKLCLPLSDIDIVISCPNFKSYSPLFTLYQYLQNQNFYLKINYIGSTQVPLIKIVTKNEYNNLSLDISLEDAKHYGVECVNYIKNMMQKYEILTPMTLAVKNILLKATLNDPYKGGLSSYGVILLILNFINIEKEKGNDISINNLGNLFYDFLHYYGEIFDPRNGIIDINNINDKSIFNRYQYQIRNGDLVIVDPLNINNNVGKNTRQFGNIKLAFRIGFITAKENCECGCHYQYDRLCLKEDGNEHNILKRIFNSVRRIGVNDSNK